MINTKDWNSPGILGSTTVNVNMLNLVHRLIREPICMTME